MEVFIYSELYDQMQWEEFIIDIAGVHLPKVTAISNPKVHVGVFICAEQQNFIIISVKVLLIPATIFTNQQGHNARILLLDMNVIP